MRGGPWLDHLPPWMAWGAIASTGAYTAWEVGAMAIPLLAGAFVQGRGGSLHRFRRLLELLALAVFLFQVVARTGVLPTVVNTLFVLCGVRLCLPRELPQRRQLLLMGFLLFLTTALATSELDFLLWSAVWVAGTAACLMEQAWGHSARLRQGPPAAPPFRRIPAWAGAAAVLAAGFFVVLPRLNLGVRGLPLGIQSLTGLHAGLSDVVDLAGKGPIQSSGDVVMRIIPLAPDPALPRAFALLRGFVLEDLQGQRWGTAAATPMRASTSWGRSPAEAMLAADCFVSPDPQSVIPAPYGRLAMDPPNGEQLRAGPGASIRWWFPVRRTLSIRMATRPLPCEPEAPPAGDRRALLTHAGPETDSALRWSERVAPGALAPRRLAELLTQELRRFRYSLDNPSGGTADPLKDFLERTRTGHCEFFATALAVMLRRRGVPARVVTGYRLGPWLAEGGYYLVTQNEAHSWVEFYDPETRGWRVADPTPAAPPSALNAGSFLAAFERLADAARFNWDRHVVRFSDQDQVAGLEWLSAKAAAWTWRRPELRGALAALAVLALLGALAWAARSGLPFLPARAKGHPGRLPQLRPLLRAAAGLAPPLPGETARLWLTRLARLRQDRKGPLETLAREADAVAYGGKGGAILARLAREEARAWKPQGKAGEGGRA